MLTFYELDSSSMFSGMRVASVGTVYLFFLVFRLILSRRSLERIRKKVHLPSLKIWVFEVHVVLFLQYFGHLAELVHVELPNERRQVFVPEVFGQDFLLKLLGVLDEDLVITKPGEVVFVLFFLNKRVTYLQNVVKFHDKLGYLLSVGFQFGKQWVHVDLRPPNDLKLLFNLNQL